MDKTRMLLLWLAGGAGVVLLYSAYKDKSPTSILSSYAQNTPANSGAGPLPNTPVHHPKSGGSQYPFRQAPNRNGQSMDVPSGYPPGTPYVPGNVN